MSMAKWREEAIGDCRLILADCLGMAFIVGAMSLPLSAALVWVLVSSPPEENAENKGD